MSFEVPDSHEGRCDFCGRHNPVWYAPSDLWNAVIRRPDGTELWSFLCPPCFASLAERRMAKPPVWRFEPDGEWEMAR